MDREALSGSAKCATLGKTCGQSREVLVTEGDQDRITAFTGGQDWWEYAYPADPDYLEQTNDPNWLKWAFRPDGSRPILKRWPSGDCPFLGSVGCTLPLAVRPLLCRLYPHTYTERGLDGILDDCPREAIPSGQTILQLLGMRLVDAVRRHRMLYAEKCLKEPRDADRVDLRPAG